MMKPRKLVFEAQSASPQCRTEMEVIVTPELSPVTFSGQNVEW